MSAYASHSANRRLTVLRVIAYSGILLATTWLIQFADTGIAYYKNWQSIVQVMPWRSWAIQGVSLVGELITLASCIGLACGLKWGRTLTVWLTVVWSVLLVMLSYWLPVLVALPVSALRIALLYNRPNSEFLSRPHAVRRFNWREFACFICLAGSCALHFWSLLAIASRSLWVWKLISHGRPLDLLIAAAILFVIGVALAPASSRVWHTGVVLMTVCVALGAQLVAQIPASTPLYKYLPDPKIYGSIPWNVLIGYCVLIGAIALLLLQFSRPQGGPRRPPLQMPDYS
jgi:hypothetical protein